MSNKRGEWPVSYHGTKSDFVGNILVDGFKPGSRDLYKFGRTHSIYTSPSIEVAEEYAQYCTINEIEFCFVFQNRLNPKTRKKAQTRIHGVYYGSTMEGIRPYGLLVKIVKKDANSNDT